MAAWQVLADVLEAVIWERVRPLAQGRPWHLVADEFVDGLEASWPAKLCTMGQADAVGVRLDSKALAERFRRLARKAGNMERIRERAIKALQIAGQLALPPKNMTLWTYFQPSKTTVVTKAALGRKDVAISRHQVQAKKRRRDAESMPSEPFASPPATTPKPTPFRPGGSAAPLSMDTPETATLESVMQSSQARVQLPGLARGTQAGYVGMAAQGRGGAIQRAFKIGVADLVTEDSVPIRDVPKLLLDVIVMLTQQVPEENELITHSKIGEWLCDLAAGDLLNDWAEFWSVRREFGPTVVLHVGHDGTRRSDRQLGRKGELMQLRASYFNPRLNKAVSFLLSMRFIVGGSAQHTARALSVNLQDGGLYRCKSDANPAVPFNVDVLQKGVLFDLEADNTDSALNVSPEMTKLTGEPCGIWPCATHINALDGKTPVLKLAGDVGVGEDARGGSHDFNRRNAMNIADKWWYICDKHWEIIAHWWPQFECNAKASSAKLTRRGLMSKWESMGAANAIVFNHADDIRKCVIHLEYFATGMTGVGTLKRDCTLLVEWMHDPELWFHFLICHDWFDKQIDPTFINLRSKSVIHPKSGPLMGRQDVPRIALNAICRAASMPAPTASDAQLDAALKQYFPNAHKHLHLSPDARPQAAVGGWCKFEIPSQDRLQYARSWANLFVPQLQTNAKKHWRQFLQDWKFAGLVTDPEVGAYAARIIYPAGGRPKDLGLTRTPQLEELDSIATKDGAQIRATLAADGLFDSAAKRKDWAKLCSCEERIDLDWTRSTLPALAPWFESRFFGGSKSNYALESGFSVYGQHVAAEQSSELKEAIVNLTNRRQPEREARKSKDMRTAKVSEKAQKRYEQERDDRAAQGLTEDLSRDSVSRKQLISRGQTLLARMEAAEERCAPTCPEIGRTATDFRKRRNREWELLFKREAKAQEGEMRSKRQKGRAQLTQDAYGRVRGLLRARKEASYLAKAQAVVDAEAALEAALEAAAEKGDGSDDEAGALAREQPRKKPKSRP